MRKNFYVLTLQSLPGELHGVSSLLTHFPCEYGTAPPTNLDQVQADLVLCSWEAWRKLKPTVGKKLPLFPPVVVISRTPGDSDWQEVLGAGAFDLVEEPHSAGAGGEFLRVVTSALDFAAKRPPQKVASRSMAMAS